MLAITAAPMLPPIVRMFAFMPLATPVCEAGTAATTSADIAEKATAAGHTLARSEVRLPAGPLRTVGEHAVQIHLHADVDLELPVIIVAEEAG